MDQPTVTEFTPELTEVAAGLEFPEGPIAMPDGSVVLVEMFGPRLTRIHPDGTKETIADIPGGPNGAAGKWRLADRAILPQVHRHTRRAKKLGLGTVQSQAAQTGGRPAGIASRSEIVRTGADA